MNLPRVRARQPLYSIIVLLALTTMAEAADVSWQLNVADPMHGFLWSTPQNWSPAGVPGPADNVFIDANSGGTLDTNLTIANLTINHGTIDSYRTGSQTLTVTGTTNIQLPITAPFGNGVYAEAGATYNLGTLANFYGGVLHGTTDNEFYADGTQSAPALIQFKGAHVIENEFGFYLQGNGHIRDQDTGLDAFRDLAVNRGDIYIVYGGALNVSGNFTNNVNGNVYMGNRAGGLNTFTVQGDFTNATDNTGLYVDSPASVTINGNLTNYGSISLRERTVPGETASLTVGGTLTMKGAGFLQLEGNVTVTGNAGMVLESQTALDMGGQPNVGTLYATKLQIKNGIEFRGAFLTGAGTIFADLIFTQGGSVFSPGHSPGQVTINGSLTFDVPTHVKMELGGLTPGTQHDQIVQHSTGSGGVTLNGVLDLSFVNGFGSTVTNSDTFTILTSDLPLSGAFTNVASGARLNTTDGAGSFRVDYPGNSVVLSQFQVAPPPVITSIPADGVPNRYITVLGTGLLGTTGATINGVSAYAYSLSATEVQVFIPSNAASGPITVNTNHGSATSSSIFTVLADSDGDGMSDQFEQQYFGNATAGDPNADGDGDGMTNLAEFLAGTDPTSGASAFRITQSRKQGNDVVISFPSVANKRYRVQASTNLTDQFPTTIAILPALGSSGPREVTDVNGLSNGKRFYRIQILQ